MIVVGAAPGGRLEIGADARFPLRLIRDSRARGRLGSTAVSRVAEALTAFLALARGSGARAIVAVATAAVREADNREEFVRRVAAQTGVEMEVLAGDAEARHAFAGAVHGLPVDSGLVVDIGGGSVEICRFQHRRPLQQWTLPLGALLLSDGFLPSDPPRSSELARARQHIAATLEGSGVPPLRPGDSLVGTGGTLRNLAKVDRARRTYPISRLHGYRLSREGLDHAADTLGSRSLARRRRVSGLSHDRADSIVGGALCAQALFTALSADELLLSGRGLREGIALERLGLGVRSVAAMRRSSVTGLARRFATWDGRRARLRAELSGRLLGGLDPATDTGLREVLEHAATLVDIGRSVDYYSRWEHAARIVADSDLYGFSHREIVLLSAVLERAGEDRVTLPGYRAVLAAPDRARLERLAVILALADALSHRLLPGEAVTTESRRSGITLAAAADLGPLEPELEQRFRRSFGKALRLSAPPRG
jgi:exopolyphosphatase/guanosine-5'-triphosphate,3'-diphosphate pyrophosphatase